MTTGSPGNSEPSADARVTVTAPAGREDGGGAGQEGTKLSEAWTTTALFEGRAPQMKVPVCQVCGTVRVMPW